MSADPNAIVASSDAATAARFEALVLPWLDAAYNLARWLVRNDADAQDVVQESLLRALRYFGSFRGGDARVWLLAIVRNTCYSLHAKHAPPSESIEDEALALADDCPSPEALTLLAVDIGSLQEALERLPHPLREVIVLRELEECSYKEIAVVTGQKIGTVMSRLSRARERLRADLARPPEEAGRHDM